MSPDPYAGDAGRAQAVRIANLGRLCRIFERLQCYREQLASAGMYSLAVSLDPALRDLYQAIVVAGKDAGE